MNVDTALVLDGGRREIGGAPQYDAAYDFFLDRPAISYPIDQLLKSESIKKVYIPSDRILDAFFALRVLRNEHPKVAFLGPDESSRGRKFVRVVPAAENGKLMTTIMETFYCHVTNDNLGLFPFHGNCNSINDLLEYREKHGKIQEFPLFLTGNDVINLNSGYVDRMISDFESSEQDVMIGYTKFKDLKKTLNKYGMDVSRFHETLSKNDFFNGEYMRHNGTFILKWGKFNRPTLEVISYFNSHRYQSQIRNYFGLIKKAAYEFRNHKKYILKGFLRFAVPFYIGKYLKNLKSQAVSDMITPYVSNENIGKLTQDLAGFRLYIRDKTDTPETVVDIDSPSDKMPIEQLLVKKYKN